MPKSNVNKNKFTRKEIEIETREYFDKLSKVVEKDRMS
jgi:hypothetical protein